MKSTILVCTILAVLACLCLQTNAACDSDNIPDDLKGQCVDVNCNEDGTEFWGSGCPEFRCQEGKQIGYKETDVSKPYPDCCPNPICAD